MDEELGKLQGRYAPPQIVSVGILMFAVLAVVFLLGTASPSLEVRYKLSYEIEVNERIRTGSGVFGIHVRESTYYGIDGISGEAIPIDLGDGRYLFSLMAGGEPIRIEGWSEFARHSMTPDKFFLVIFRDYAMSSSSATLRRLQEEMPVVEVPTSVLPKLYVSADVNEPDAFVSVKPGELENLGIKIRRVTAAITEETVTRGRIVRVLPWLDGFTANRWMARGEFIR